jgi:hypothetical protein
MDNIIISWIISGVLAFLLFLITKPGNQKEKEEEKNNPRKTQI